MTYQRSRGVPVKIWPQKLISDDRGNERWEVDKDAGPITNSDGELPKASFNPDRSTEDDIPGQQEVDVATIIVHAALPGVGSYSRVEIFGNEWDVVTPPQYKVGASRHTRHWTIKIRRRPTEPFGDPQ